MIPAMARGPLRLFLCLLIAAGLLHLIGRRALNYQRPSGRISQRLGLNVLDKPLKVLFVLPPWLPVPPEGSGGVENVAAALIPSLERQGASLTVTLPVGSSVKATQLLEITEPLSTNFKHRFWEIEGPLELYISKIMDIIRQGDFDLIHDFSGLPAIINTLAAPLIVSDGSYPPVIHTVHSLFEEHSELYDRIARYPRMVFTGISQSQFQHAAPHVLARTKIIYNGVDPSEFIHGPGAGPVLVLGRICPNKGQARLVSYANSSGTRLDIAGTVAGLRDSASIVAETRRNDSSVAPMRDFQYYLSFKDMIDGESIRFLGNVGGTVRAQLLGGAAALAMPITWEEPFGMVAIEAMASGTPVVAMALGALPEIVIHGKTGYLAETWEEFTQYLQPEMLQKISRDECRRRVQENFSSDRMAADYYKLYLDIVAGRMKSNTKSILLESNTL